MTATDQNALALAPRGSSSHLNRPARQVVPAFLQKLYEMVNDPSDQDLIRWSDSGDTFFVLDQERFASEVLGRWFKHKNFSSFVRQLNMYGFHKIPHLQQGVLRSDQEADFWNFEHPNFIRGQPDLLCLIQRKKQTAAGAPPNIGAGGTQDDGTQQQAAIAPVLDVNQIVNGIAAIKRHQATISTDLNTLRTSNQELWREAMAARERHKKHQDTINKILKFLASVFGHGAASHHNHGSAPLSKGDNRDREPNAGAVVSRSKAGMLMIDDGRKKAGQDEANGESE
ncbi:hypothetical protein CONPUDRAFT_68066 [Coniophora puteana RWD-64-598 SS2]|uniref:HSF-type DNA-binding domain-containing protein n=1 Tax=Coniophora puteana (strain RWD-64-598) TaxID=741705 RepID=R7SCU2_CONPW|nr:uncharacterized protein CONPUDRAFT_68066 [Coniophora puteana RWD-64-598 SS2]EIW73978.1 hypothetical protein CONPUDRAFT_68066 [Coniophora puteana RWD-64-598 SS2]